MANPASGSNAASSGGGEGDMDENELAIAQILAEEAKALDNPAPSDFGGGDPFRNFNN